MTSKHFVSALIDEVALEGLDGITLQGLWLRLEDRKDFGLKPVNIKVKHLVWNILKKANCIDFFLLSSPRPNLVIYNRFAYTDATGSHYEPDKIDNLYPHSPVNDEINGVMGSCAEYDKRENISDVVRLRSLEESIKEWGDKLVIVADQKTRKKALCGVAISPLIELNVNNYCLLERIGRGRQYGEVTQGKFGLQIITNDSKMLFYFRKCLIKLNLISVQSFYLKIKNVNCVGKLVHLKRFSVIIKSKHTTDAEKIIEHLKGMPMKYIPYKDLGLLDLKVDLKKILQKHTKVLKSEMVPYRVVYPNATQSQWKIKSNGREKLVRILRLVESELGNDEEEEEDEEEEKSGLLDESRREVGRPLLRQGYMAVERSHIMGMSQVAMVTELGITSLQARSICKLLKKYKLCGTMMSDVGRQRVTLFYCKKFESLKHSMSSVVADEKSKLLEIINNESTVNVPNSIKRRSISKDGPHAKAAKTSHTTKDVAAPDEGPNSSQPEIVTLKKRSKDELDDIETEIIVSTPGELSDKPFPSLMESTSEDGSSNLTLRMLKRAKLILQAVNALKVIQDPQKLQRMINEEEDLEGFNYIIDRRTVLRIIEKLKADGHVKVIKVTLRGHGKEKSLTFICHPTITPEHVEIQSAIEQAKMKLPIITKELINKTNKTISPSPLKEKLIHDHRIGRMQYGYKPKFVRLRTMHFYMYYLIYDYTGKKNLNQNLKHEILRKQNLDPSLVDEMQTIYHDTLDWRMFIPPLPVHDDYPRGWCLVSDLLLRLPLFMFVNLVNVNYKVPNIHDYLDHPVRKYYLVKDLPTEIANHLTIMRKYIFTISEVISQLAYIGLVQYGPQILKEKDQVFVYLNRNAMLLDTTISDEGYNHISKDREYEEKTYHFKSSQNLETYWADLWRFAMHTKLGSRNCVSGQPVVVESVYTKKQMMDTLKPKTPAEADVCDIGYLPGDQLGAGGLDSDLFVHLKRNWYWSANNIKNSAKVAENIKTEKPETAEATAKRPNKRKSTQPIKHTDSSTSDKLPPGVREMSRESHTTGSVTSQIVRTMVINNPQSSISRLDPDSQGFKKSLTKPRMKIHTKITRIMQPRVLSERKPYYDQKDKEALKRMKKLRVDWTPAEDNVLLLCKVATYFMCTMKVRKHTKNLYAIRDLLHNILPEVSMNKTSRACQRRITYMMKNPSTAHSVDICLGELRQDEELRSKYGCETVSKLQEEFRKERESQNLFKNKYDELFTEFVHVLLKRLKSISDNKSNLDGSVIPDSLEELYDKYIVVLPSGNILGSIEKYNEVQNNVDIMCSVVNSVIHSSLAGVTDKTCYSYQLLHIYQQYPDKLLRSVMAKCRAMAIVSVKKFSKPFRKNSDRCLPLSTSPFQLSQNYVNILQARYQYQIFYHSFCGFTKLINTSVGNQIMELDVQNGGECANVVELYSCGLLSLDLQFPDQVIVLDPKLADTEETYEQILKRFRDFISHIKSNRRGKKNTKGKKGNETDFEDDDEFLKDDDYEEFNLSNTNGLASAASRLGLYMLRDDGYNSLDSNLQHAHDYFVLNPCKISVNFSGKSNEIKRIFEDTEEKQKLLNALKESSILPDRESEEVDIKYSNGQALEILHFIEGKKELGATFADIRMSYGCESVTAVQELLDHQSIIQSGVIALRFIHMKFVKPWVVKSYRLPRLVRDSLATGQERQLDIAQGAQKPEPAESDQPPKKKVRMFSNISKESVRKFYQVKESNCLKEIEVLIRPWIRVDGTVNRRVLDRLLGSILGFVLQSPGASLLKIQQRFVPALQPVHSLELVNMLSKIGCLQKKTFSNRSRATLFSKRFIPTPVDATGLEESSEIFLDPEPLAITRLGLFIGKKAYAEDYLHHMLNASSRTS